VLCEPVSCIDSLLTAKNTGNCSANEHFSDKTEFPTKPSTLVQPIQRLAPTFPTNRTANFWRHISEVISRISEIDPDFPISEMLGVLGSYVGVEAQNPGAQIRS